MASRPIVTPASGVGIKSAPSAPALDEVVQCDDQVDVVEEIAPLPRASRRIVPPAPQEEVVDNVDVVEEVSPETDDVDVVEEENPGEDDVDVVDEELSPLAVADGADPFAGQDVSEERQQDIRKELTNGEKIVWVGRPSLVLLVSNARIVGIALIVFGLVVAGGLSFLAEGWPRIGLYAGGGMVSIFGILLVLLPMTKRASAGRGVYVLTNRRALIYEGRLFGTLRMRAYNVAQLKNMQRKDSTRVKGAGDLIFEMERIIVGTGPALPGRTMPTRGPRKSEQTIPHGFLMVENVRAVEKLVRETLIDRGFDKLLAPEF